MKKRLIYNIILALTVWSCTAQKNSIYSKVQDSTVKDEKVKFDSVKNIFKTELRSIEDNDLLTISIDSIIVEKNKKMKIFGNLSSTDKELNQLEIYQAYSLGNQSYKKEQKLEYTINKGKVTIFNASYSSNEISVLLISKEFSPSCITIYINHQ